MTFGGESKALRLLYLEDQFIDATVVKKLVGTITRPSIELHHVENLRDAMSLIANEQFDIVLSDLGLPDSNGISTLIHLREVSDAPIIVLTGDDDERSTSEALREGAQDYLVKGEFTADDLHRSITYALERHVLEVKNKLYLKELLEAKKKTEETVIELEALNIALASEMESRIAAQEESTMLGAAIEQAAESFVLLDRDRTIVYANPAFEEMTGYSRSEAYGKSPDFLRSDSQDSQNYEQMLEAVLTGKPWRGHLTSKKKDGSILEEKVTISPIRNSDGVVTRLVSISRDITREAALEQRLRETQKLEAIGQLAAGIAHEINTPTQYVGDNINFLQESFGAFKTIIGKYEDLIGALGLDTSTPEAISEIEKYRNGLDIEFLLEDTPNAIEQSLDGVSRIATIVAAMKEFSHPGSDEKTFHDLNRAINSTITVARNEWKYVAEMETDFYENLPLVPCVLGEINQAFLNMIVNAAHSIEAREDSERKKGKIRISTVLTEPYAEIRIKDTGIGIPQKNLQRVFEPFFTTKSLGKGTGQGLAIAYSTIVNKHGGQLLVSSVEGEGTEFTILLPLVGCKETGEVSSMNEGMQLNGSQM